METRFAFVFPGQGSQHINMFSELAQTAPVIERTFAQASEALGYDLWDLTQNQAEKLNQTVYTQPALLTAGVAVWRLWCERVGILPVQLAGHSLGEYTALVCAEALNFTDAVMIVQERGRLMQEAVPESQGAMAALIGLDAADVEKVCQLASESGVAEPANYNAIGQIVISGSRAGVEKACELAKMHGAKLAKILPVSVPSHCSLMKPAAEKLAQYLKQFTLHTPKLPVLQNVDANVHETQGDIQQKLIEQLYSPVQWIKTIEKLHAADINLLIECGPGTVLGGLNKRIIKSVTTLSLATPEAFLVAVEDL